VDAGVRDLYEHTAKWRMDAWSQWSAPFLPDGALITALFGTTATLTPCAPTTTCGWAARSSSVCTTGWNGWLEKSGGSGSRRVAHRGIGSTRPTRCG